MAFPTKVTDHAAQAIGFVLSQFLESPRLRALVEIFGDQVQAYEDLAFDVVTDIILENAEGVQLDRWGRYVGELRGSFSDADFRKVINARIAANQSEGGPTETIIYVVKTISEADVVHVQQVGRAYFLLEYEVLSPLSQELRNAIVRLVGLAKSSGIGCDIIEAESGAAFTYDIGPGYDVGKYASLIGSA